MEKKVVLGLSGGMDSATLAAYYLDKGFQVFPVSFSYGSKHGEYERRAAQKLCFHYKHHTPFETMELKEIDLSFVPLIFTSNLLKTGGEIPEGHYQDSNMSLTVVPARNILFVSIMTGYAWSIGAGLVSLGVHAGDHAIYEDCREEFVAAMNAAVLTGTGNRVRIEAPFQQLNKAKILQVGFSLSAPPPYEFTRTCYKYQEKSCGRCGACRERLEAFEFLGRKDPIQYE